MSEYKKYFPADYFGWHYYCPHARRGLKQSEKRQTNKRYRQFNKSLCQSEYNEEVYEEDPEILETMDLNRI